VEALKPKKEDGAVTQTTGRPGNDKARRVEPETRDEARSAAPAGAEVGDSAQGRLLARLVSRENLNAAYKKVRKNKGAPGVDGMTVEEALPYIAGHRDEIIRKLEKGTYKPQPVRRVEIPKPDGGVRLLGVPTVVDRVIQQALVQILTPVFEPTFSQSSYGFRPGRSAHQAVMQAKEYYAAGYSHVVDIDLAKYFDTVNHEILMDMVMTRVKERPIIRLIRAFLKSGVMINGVVTETGEGTPQGGNLSPLLSNIYLTRFDKLLEGRGHKFVRYADDCNIYLKSRKAAERVMEQSVAFLEGKRMKLKVNREKSEVGSPTQLKFLGFALYTRKDKTKGVRIHPKSVKRFKAKVREITKRNRGRKFDVIVRQLKQYTDGWLQYYGLADMKGFVEEQNQRIRRRLRMYVWKQWKKVKAKLENLQKLGASRQQAWKRANTRKGYWRTAGSWILSTTITNARLEKRGYADILKKYLAVHENYRTAVYRTVRTVV
jgi:group II intron reverse transcriptase/maturase